MSRAGTVLAFDFGLARTGVAVGEPEVGLAHPVTVLHTTDPADRLARIAPLVRDWSPVRFVVGRPVADDGTPHPLWPAIDAFAEALQAVHTLPVDFADEGWSSAEASSRLAEAGVRGRAQKALLDAHAACAILETWFSTRARAPA
jgi:putative holliday junction resolvase